MMKHLLLLRGKFPGHWIGGVGPIPWLARSPDPSCCDYYLWGRVKNLVYQGNTSTRELTWMRIQQPFASFQQEQIRRVTQALYERVEFWIQNQGMHFEHLY